MDVLTTIVLLIAGAIGGFLAGLLGIGGGPIYAVILGEYVPMVYQTQVTESELIQMVIANTVFARMFAGCSGSWQQYKLNNFHLKPVLTIAAPAIIMSLTLSSILSKINYSKTTFSIIFILLFLPLLYKMITDNKEKKRFNQPYRIKVFFLNMVGFLSGSVTALAGLGGGFVVTPLLNALFNIKIRKVISISLGVVFIVSSSFTLFNLFIRSVETDIPWTVGLISLPLSLPMIVGVIAVAPLGVRTSKKLTPYRLRMIFIVFCIFIILKTLIRDLLPVLLW